MFANKRMLWIVLFFFLSPVHAMEKLTLHINHHIFYMEVPMTKQEYNQGLMNRKSLPRNHGMFFIFDLNGDHPSMWMKNTHIPLDMLFIGKDHKIACIVEDTKPMSLTQLHCDKSVIAVMELNAGTVKTLHLRQGMTVHTKKTPI